MNRRHGQQLRLAYERKLPFTPTISSLALLKVNYDRQRKDYFENFVPMVVECLSTPRRT